MSNTKNTIQEEWRLVANSPSYSVSSFGRVRRNDTGRIRHTPYPLNSKGYPLITLSNRRTYAVHRLVAIAHLPNPLGLPEVNHKDGIKINIHRDNLEWLTTSDNAKHAHRTGLQMAVSGESHGMARLTQEDVDSLRGLRSKGVPVKTLAERFGVSRNSVYRIIKGERWAKSLL